MVLVHGLPGSVRDYRWLAPALKGFRVIRIDLPGFGATPLHTMPWPRPEMKGLFVHTVCAALGLPRYLLVGHSAGASVVASQAAQFPEAVFGLMLINPIGARPHRSRREMTIPPSLLSIGVRIPGLRSVLLPRIQQAFERAGFHGHPGVAVAQTLHSLAALSFRRHGQVLSTVRVPTALVWSEDDPLIERGIYEELSGIAPTGPRVVFSDGGHNLQKTRAVELSEVLRRWEPQKGR